MVWFNHNCNYRQARPCLFNTQQQVSLRNWTNLHLIWESDSRINLSTVRVFTWDSKCQSSATKNKHQYCYNHVEKCYIYQTNCLQLVLSPTSIPTKHTSLCGVQIFFRNFSSYHQNHINSPIVECAGAWVSWCIIWIKNLHYILYSLVALVEKHVHVCQH